MAVTFLFHSLSTPHGCGLSPVDTYCEVEKNDRKQLYWWDTLLSAGPMRDQIFTLSAEWGVLGLPSFLGKIFHVEGCFQ